MKAVLLTVPIGKRMPVYSTEVIKVIMSLQVQILPTLPHWMVLRSPEGMRFTIPLPEMGLTMAVECTIQEGRPYSVISYLQATVPVFMEQDFTIPVPVWYSKM